MFLRERGDALDLGGRAELDLVPRDRRTAGEPGDLGVDLELLEHDRVSASTTRSFATLRVLVRRAGHEEGLVGQRVGDVAGRATSCSTRAGRLDVGGGTSGLLGARAPAGAAGRLRRARRQPAGASPGRAASRRAAAGGPSARADHGRPARTPRRRRPLLQRSTARGGDRGVGRWPSRRLDRLASSSVGAVGCSSRSRSSRSRVGDQVHRRRRDDEQRRTSRGGSSTPRRRDGTTAAASGLEARKPMMPPAARIASAPSGGCGMPSDEVGEPAGGEGQRDGADDRGGCWTPSSSGARRKRSPKASRTSGTRIPDPAQRAGDDGVDDVADDARTPHHSRAATTTASADEGEPDAVAAVLGLEVAGRAADAADRAAGQVRDTHPGAADRRAAAAAGPPERAFDAAAGGRLARRRAAAAAGRLARRRHASGGRARTTWRRTRVAMVGTVRESHLRLTRHTRPRVRGAERPSAPPGVVSDRERSVLLVDGSPRASLPS